LIDSKYILIYQLDALIIKDELNHWCSRDYDYIGAPWFDIETKYSFYQKLCNSSNAIFRWIKRKVDFNKGQKIFVGNGGFSLRKIKTFKSVSKWLPFIEPNLFKYKINEDIVWSILVPKYFRNFKIPCREEALFFSIETNPSRALREIKNELPFGCHGWDNKNSNFWSETLKKYNIEV
jgi:hypothetical protein